MRNAILPSISSQIYNFGNNEVQTPNMEVSMPMDTTLTNVHEGGFSMESIPCNNDNQPRSGGLVFPCQSNFNYHPGYQSTLCNCDYISQQLLLGQKRSLPQFEAFLHNASKSSIEVDDLLPKDCISDLVGSEVVLNECSKNKKIKLTNSSEEQWHHLVKEASKQIHEHKLQVPVKRSQKLSDKITALQKLVSPYGKTDATSVLQETSIYINLLQNQIENLFHLLSGSYYSVRALDPQGMGEKRLDLRSRGLCLVPISLTQKVTEEDIGIQSISNKAIIIRRPDAIYTHY